MTRDARRIVGVETEYGLVAHTDGRRLTSDEAAQRLFAPFAARHASTSAFLPNGGRLYLDVGAHPEYATPECTSASDLVVAQRAGDAVLLELAAHATAAEAEQGRATTFRLLRNNVDGFGNTWGSHENYLVGRDTDPDALGAWLVPFLVSRLLIGGTGHWRRGRFTLSQRGDVLADVVSNQTTRTRPLINTRDEPHGDPARFRRLHVIAGDTHSLEFPMWLTVVATELVLRRSETGGEPPTGPADPLAALKAWNLDPDAAFPATDGGTVTARALQRAYLHLAEDEATDDETRRGWEAWRTLLDDLDAGRPTAAEWDAKRRLITAWQERHGLAPDDPRLDALDVRWHELGSDAGRPRGLARIVEAAGGSPRVATDEQVASAVRIAPSPGRARLRGAFVAAARAHDRSHAVDWSHLTVHDLPDAAGRPSDVTVRLDDPFVATDPRVDDLVARMQTEPRARALGGFAPPPRGASGGAGTTG